MSDVSESRKPSAPNERPAEKVALHIQTFTVAELKECLRTGSWIPGEPMPITRHRALSHVQNPRAEPGDVALLVAYDGDAVVAHLGVLPDLVYAKDSAHKIGWLTAWWANSDRKYAGIGMMLLARAFALYRGRLGASGFSEAAQRVYTATKKFEPIGELEGISTFARLNLARLLRQRKPQIARYKALLGALDLVVNQVVQLRQWWWQKRQGRTASFRLEYLMEMDEEADEFIRKHSAGSLSRRGATELNWIARYPWMLSAPLAPRSSFRFASQVESYSVSHLKIYDADERLVAVLMLTTIEDHLTVPYCFHEGRSALVAQVLAHLIIARRAERLTIYQKDLVERLAALRFPWLLVRKKRRSWIWSRDCSETGGSGYALQDGDGDCAFTL